MTTPVRGLGWLLALVWLVWSIASTGCRASEPTPRAAPREAAAPLAPAPLASGPCEHGLPAALCTKCNPELAPVFQSKGDWCPEHGFPESLCPICNPGVKAPEIDPEAAMLEARTIRFTSSEIEARAGIETVAAEQHVGVGDSIECTARLAFHGDRIAEVHAIVPGIVRRVHVELGDAVEVGDALFELESTRVGEFQAALHGASERARTAQANLERKRELLAGEITSKRQVELAEQELAAAKADAGAATAALRMVGAAKAGSSGRYTLTSPIAGTIVRRPAVLGVLASEATSLATVADTSVLWVLCDVPERAAAKLALGQALDLQIAGDATTHAGTLTWIAAEIDPRTRTLTAQAEIPNPSGTLRANQFGVATITTSAPASALVVPREAVQRVGARELVFVREAAGVYQPRVVRRHGGGERVAIEGRVKAGEAVVTTGAVLLRTEIMPGSIGAGCCEAGPAEDP